MRQLLFVLEHVVNVAYLRMSLHDTIWELSGFDPCCILEFTFNPPAKTGSINKGDLGQYGNLFNRAHTPGSM